VHKGMLRYIITIYAPMIYTAPCIMFWMRAYPLRGEVGGGWALHCEKSRFVLASCQKIPVLRTENPAVDTRTICLLPTEFF
jgi:hypothetical protein